MPLLKNKEAGAGKHSAVTVGSGLQINYNAGSASWFGNTRANLPTNFSKTVIDVPSVPCVSPVPEM
jgi:hypothetical protein